MSDNLFDHAVRDWLEDGSDRTPPGAIDAVLLAVKTTPQERDLRVLRRTSQMPTYLRLAAGIAIVAVVGVGAVLFLNRGSCVGGRATPAPTLAPTASPTAAPTPFVAPSPTPPSTVGWIPFTSPQYGYQISYPPTWQEDNAATRNWVLATDRLASTAGAMNGSADHFNGDGLGLSGNTAVTGFAADVPAGTSEDAWLMSYYAGAAFCPTVMPNFVAITVDGHPGRLDPCYDAQAIVFIGKRVYVFAIHRTDNQPLFASFLSTVKFQ